MSNKTAADPSLIAFANPTFTVVDYIVFAAFLSVSGAVGIYFSIKGHRDTNDYLFGGRQLGPIPIGISNGVSFLSALSLIGYPSELYINGIEIFFDVGIGPLAILTGGCLVARVVYPLNMMSLSEYFLKRFHSKLLFYIANIVVVLCIFHYMGSCMLGSIVAFNNATGGTVSIFLGLTIAGAVGIFYTSMGGLKAVVWTDVIQFGFMLLGVIAILIRAVTDTPGGFSTIVQMNRKYQRIRPLNWSLNPTIRHTVWGMTLGKFLYIITWPIQPAGVQRFCSAKNQRDSYKVAGVSAMLQATFSGLPLLAGMAIFGYYSYHGCDIYKMGWVTSNEIVTYFVRDRLSIPGFQGFFIASLFSGSLSSFSSGLNSASAILWKDTIKPLLKTEVSEFKGTLISKIIVVIFGMLSMMWCYGLFSIGGLILQLTQSLDAPMYGSYGALFLFAILFRHANSKGALSGMVVSFSCTLWLSFSSVLYGTSKNVVLPTNTSLCFDNRSSSVIDIDFNEALNDSSTSNSNDHSILQSIYSLSYVWLTGVCIMISFVVGIVVSCATTRKKSVHVDDKYLLVTCGRQQAKRYDGHTEGSEVMLNDVKEHEQKVKLQCANDLMTS